MRRGLSTWLLLLVFASLPVVASAPARVVAQDQPPITLDVRVGYEGAYRVGEWFPVSVSIGNDGPDLRGVLEWSFTGQADEQVFRQVIDLPRGSRKRVMLEVFARDFARTGQLRLLDGENPLVARDISLDAADAGVFLAGVISSDPAMLNSLNSLQLTGFSSTLVRHLDAADLPEHTALLRGLNALFLHDTDSAALSPAQRDALGPARCIGPVGQLGWAAVCQRRGRRAEGRHRPGRSPAGAGRRRAHSGRSERSGGLDRHQRAAQPGRRA
jgi:hypothetical protein